jgi:hypothetical protein
LGTFILTAVATDNQGAQCASAPIMVSVIDNRPPTCEPVAATTAEDTTVDITLLGSDPDGDALTYTVTQPSHGSVSVSGNVATYVPALNYNGPDSFTYTVADPSGTASDACPVTVEVTPVNDAPVCSDALAVTDEDVAVNISLVASDVDSADLTFSIVSGPANGTASISGNVATYTPAAGYSGSDSFTFKVSDGLAESGVCTVSITINAVMGGPVAVIDVSPLADLGDAVPGLIVISANGENACVTLDGSQSSSEGGTALTYVWVVDGDIVGTTVAVELCLSVGSHEVTLMVNDGTAEGQTTVTVDVLSPAEAIEELIMVVNDSIIARSNKQPFLATLKTAAAAFERGSYGSALNRLTKAFQNKVNAQVGKTNPDVADEWNRIAQVIVDAVTNPPECEACEE